MSDSPAHLVQLLLLHAAQIAALAAVVGLASRPLGRRWPHAAYALWLVVLLKCVTPPLVLIGVPGVLLLSSHQPAADLLTVAEPSQREVNRAAVSQPAPDASGAALAASAEPFPWAALLTAGWACGAVSIAGVSIGRNTECRRFLSDHSRELPPELSDWFDEYCERLNVPRPRVHVTTTRVGPAVVGVLRPAIYLPAELLEKSPPERLRMVLAHEAAHIRRRDAWVAALQLAAQVLWWPYPVVWWVNRQIIRQRERCCDAEVVASLSEHRQAYAQSLIDVLDLSCQHPPALSHLGLRPVQLVQSRLEEIMTRPTTNNRRGARWAWGLAAVLAAAVLPIGVGPLAAAPTSAAEESTAEKKEQPRRLEYGDGKPDGKKSLGGSGQLIEFTLPDGEPALKAIRIHGSRYGTRRAPQEDFDIAILSEDMQEVITIERAPYGLFRRGDQKWVTVRFKEPLKTPKRFWIALDFHAEQTKGVYVSYDDATEGKHSRVGLAEEPDKVKPVGFKADWMIQALLDWD